jgi:pimeloyl-ACP methyl ester carboxylesterase
VSQTPPTHDTAPRPIVRRAVGVLCLGLAVVLGVPMLLYFLQERLIFHPQRLTASQRDTLVDRPGFKGVTIQAASGERLRGWLAGQASSAPQPLVLYFGGNAEEVSWMLSHAQSFQGWRLALINYRGYGDSEGRPSEQALFADALTVYDTLTKREDVDGSRVVVIGRSLGSGIAVYLASHRALDALVLISPYDSIRSIAHARYPYIPVDLLLKHPFDSLSRASDIRTPLVALVAGRDRTVAPERSARLVAAWGGAAEIVHFPEADHQSIASDRRYWRTFERVLRQTVSAPALPRVRSSN